MLSAWRACGTRSRILCGLGRLFNGNACKETKIIFRCCLMGSLTYLYVMLWTKYKYCYCEYQYEYQYPYIRIDTT